MESGVSGKGYRALQLEIVTILIYLNFIFINI